jgi:hypothetical protein
MDPQTADRLAMASIWWARRPGPTAEVAIRTLIGGLSDADKWEVCDRFGAADALPDEELQGRLVALGGKAVRVERKELR